MYIPWFEWLAKIQEAEGEGWTRFHAIELVDVPHQRLSSNILFKICIHRSTHLHEGELSNSTHCKI